MYKDSFRKEDALPAYLYMKIIRSHIADQPDYKEQYASSMEALRDCVSKCLDGLTVKKQQQLLRSLDRTAANVIRYFAKNNFKIAKANVCLTEWVVWILRSQFIQIDRRGELAKYIYNIRKIIRRVGYNEIEGFGKMHASANNHVLKIHAIIEQDGYYL